MVYARRFGAFMGVATFTTSLIATYLINPRVELWSPSHWQTITVCIVLALLVPIFFLFYVLNLALIRFGGKRDLFPKLKNRWYGILSLSDPLSAPVVDDYVDRVADLQIRCSTPGLLRDVFAGLQSQQHEVNTSLRRSIQLYAERNELGAVVKLLGDQWRRPSQFVASSSRLVDDPVHGCISLEPALSTIIAQPIVQRLGHIKQLSFSYAQYPSATHSRLSHVLGVAHNVETALNGVFSRGVYYQEGDSEPVKLPAELRNRRDEIILRAKLLALLHDLGHGPFGHALDSYVGYINRHENSPNPDKVYSLLYVERYLAETLKRLGFDPADLMGVLDGKKRASSTGFDSLIGDLIDSSMDMDRMDYLIRDAHMTGLNMGFTNADSLIQCVRPLKSGDSYLLAYDETGIEYMEHLLYAREAMYRSCYEHPRKRAAERLFERLVREIASDDAEKIDDLYILTDEELLCALRLVKSSSDRVERLLGQLVTALDYMVVHEVRIGSDQLSDEVKTWVSGATKGKGKPSYIDKPAQWEDSIARDSVGVERAAEIQAIVPPASAYVQKFNSTPILSMENRAYRIRQFFDVASDAKEVLSAMNPARAKIRIMCPSNLPERDKESIRQASVAELGS
jgi:uncharacterized protein